MTLAIVLQDYQLSTYSVDNSFSYSRKPAMRAYKLTTFYPRLHILQFSRYLRSLCIRGRELHDGAYCWDPLGIRTED